MTLLIRYRKFMLGKKVLTLYLELTPTKPSPKIGVRKVTSWKGRDLKFCRLQKGRNLPRFSDIVGEIQWKDFLGLRALALE